MGKLLRTKKLVKNYTNKAETLFILKGIDFSIDYGESISIAGESGSGKSTFLNMIGGLDYVTDGNVFIDEIDITKLDEYELAFFRNKKIGFIFQQHYLLDEFNALENVMIPYLINDFNKKRAAGRAKELLDFLGMNKRFHHYPSQLSGGEKQRVAIARAFINEPSLILADEPTGNLDEENSSKVLELLFNISKKGNHSLIIVSHSPNVARLADKSFLLEAGNLTQKK